MAELFEERPVAVLALIRGLSSPEFEESVLSAYDAMRGAGMTVEDVAARPAPAGTTRQDIGETLRALRADGLAGWNPKQRYSAGVIMDEAGRVANADGPLETLRAIENFSKNLPGCKRGTSGYQLVEDLQRQIKKELLYTAITELYEQERALLLDIVRRFDRIYRESKRAAGALDFADLEEYAVRLLEENPDACARLQQQFDYILMDEFQDTNGQQAKLLKLIRRPGRFFAVGDINQSIFGFRHTEPAVFREYRASVEHSGQRLIELVDNFRSRPDILRAVETVADGAAGVEKRSLVAGREFPEDEADRGGSLRRNGFRRGGGFAQGGALGGTAHPGAFGSRRTAIYVSGCRRAGAQHGGADGVYESVRRSRRAFRSQPGQRLL